MFPCWLRSWIIQTGRVCFNLTLSPLPQIRETAAWQDRKKKWMIETWDGYTVTHYHARNGHSNMQTLIMNKEPCIPRASAI